MIAVVTVLALVFFALGWREALIVAVSIPIIYSLTLLVNYWFGYTINRVTLFALVLALGLLVDDPIVDVENIYRHFKMKKEPPRDAVLTAVDEVRPPVILATLAVILSFLPMLFITGMMGPYMRPMAINLPLTMLMSLLVAFTVTPWMTYHVLKGEYGKEEHEFVLEESRTYRVYRRIVEPFLDSRRKAWLLVGGVVLLLLGSMALPVLNLVPMKMLPFDNKNEFQLVIDLPEGSRPWKRPTAWCANWRITWRRSTRSPISPPTSAPPAPWISTAWSATTTCARGRTSPISASTWQPRARRSSRATRSPCACAMS